MSEDSERLVVLGERRIATLEQVAKNIEQTVIRLDKTGGEALVHHMQEDEARFAATTLALSAITNRQKGQAQALTGLNQVFVALMTLMMTIAAISGAYAALVK